MSDILRSEETYEELNRKMYEMIAQSGQMNGVHLDIGCRLSNFAAEMKEKNQLDYVGVSLEPTADSVQRKANCTVCECDFENPDNDYNYIRNAIGGRLLASISITSVLERVKKPERLLGLLRKLAADNCAVLIVCVPNIAHKDIAYKLLAGKFDYQESGLINKDQLFFFTENNLENLTNATGWREINRTDMKTEISDQCFPKNHTLLIQDSMIHTYLDWLESLTNPNATVSYFIRSFLPGPISDLTTVSDKSAKDRPFLSIITRSQGKRESTLKEVFLCLAGQECIDFEVLVIGHKLNTEKRQLVDTLIQSNPEWLRKKIRLLEVDNGTRTTPLNYGFEQAQGQYIAILDDDDVVFANWVETFKQLFIKHPGRVLHANCVRQDWTPVKTIFGTETVRAVGTTETPYYPVFDFLEEFYHNHCPPVTLAFPSSAFLELGIRFDEMMTTTEDWDFLMRTVLVCGIANSTTVTCLYRWWINSENSITEHCSSEWERNFNSIQTKLARIPILLPIESSAKINNLVDRALHPSIQANRDAAFCDTYRWENSLYFNQGEGFDEKLCVKNSTQKLSGDFRVIFDDLEYQGDITELRWDPTEQAGFFLDRLTITITYSDNKKETFDISQVTTNGIQIGNSIWFPKNDPNIIIPSSQSVKKVIISGTWYPEIPEKYLRILARMNKIYSDVIESMEEEDSALLKPNKLVWENTLYFDSGEGFSEEKCIRNKLWQTTGEFSVVFDALDTMGILKSLRWDPTEQKDIYFEKLMIDVVYQNGKHHLLTVEDVESNGIRCDSRLWFPMSDPNIFLLPDPKVYSITFSGIWGSEAPADFVNTIKTNLKNPKIVLQPSGFRAKAKRTIKKFIRK